MKLRAIFLLAFGVRRCLSLAGTSSTSPGVHFPRLRCQESTRLNRDLEECTHLVQAYTFELKSYTQHLGQDAQASGFLLQDNKAILAHPNATCAACLHRTTQPSYLGFRNETRREAAVL